MSRRARVVMLIVAASVAVIFLYAVRGVLTPFALAAVIAYLAHPLVQEFEERHIPRGVAIVLVYLVLAVAGGLVINLVVPLLVRELNDVLVGLPQTRGLERYATGALEKLVLVRKSEVLRNMVVAAVQRVEQLFVDLASHSLDVLVGLVTRAFSLVLAPFLAYYLLRDWELLRRGLLALIPIEYEGEVLVLARRLNRVLAGFVRGQLLISALMGLLVALGLGILRVRYAVLIGLLAGVFEVIPYFGPAIGAVPAVLFGLLRSPTTALWAAVWILLLHQLEGAVLQPRIMSTSVGLHPLTVIFAVLAGGSLLGVWGLLVALPVAAALRVVGGYLVEKITGSAPGDEPR
jgi:predicted PurR-regulated permease PerM